MSSASATVLFPLQLEISSAAAPQIVILNNDFVFIFILFKIVSGVPVMSGGNMQSKVKHYFRLVSIAVSDLRAVVRFVSIFVRNRVCEAKRLTNNLLITLLIRKILTIFAVPKIGDKNIN